MSTEYLLFITLIIYMIGILLATTYDKRIFMFVSILWFVPIFTIENTIITLFSVIMLLFHILIPIVDKNHDDFD